VFLSTGSPQSVAAHLRRLTEDRQLPARLLVVTEERQPLPHLGAKGRERWEELQKRKGLSFTHRELAFEEYAALDALQHVVGMAVSGDLEVEWPRGQIRPVNEKEVIESHHRKQRYRSHPFLNRFLEEPVRNREDQLLSTSRSSEGGSSPSSTGVLMVQALDSLWIGNLANQMPVNLPVKVLPNHLAVVGSSGCGKTHLAKVLVEEAILHDIPVLAIDSQGDLVQLLKPQEPEQFTGIIRRRFDLYWERVEPRIYTPGSAHGIPISLNPLRLARESDLVGLPDPARREELLHNILETVAGNLVALAVCGGETDSQKLFLRKLLEHLIRNSKDSSLEWDDVVHAVQEPQQFGIEDPNSLVKNADRENLARKLNGLKENSLFFGSGQVVDLDELCRPQDSKKVPLNVIYVNALTEDEKQNFVAALAAEIYRWMVTSPISRNPRLLLYVDEALDYFPAGAIQPPSKGPLKRLFREAGKYGLACLICSQSLRKVEFEVIDNCNTKMVGRLHSAQDMERVTQWFTNQASRPIKIKDRKDAVHSFVARWPEMREELDGQPFKSRELFSLHEDAWSPEQVEIEMSDNPIRKAVTQKRN
jgi:DNA helicase HerA-like ATPase